MSARRVLLTGATGLIGRQTIAPLRERGFTVVALSHSSRSVAGVDETVVADLLDGGSTRAAVRSAAATHLIHLAWHDTLADRWTSPKNIDWSAATLQLVRRFAEAGGQCAVIAGSCAEYDWRAEGPFSEGDALGAATLYGRAKAATGALLMAAAREIGISLAWARIFFCYGPGEPPGRLVGDLIAGLSSGNVVECTDGRQARDFLHTADIGRALALLADRKASGPVNVGSGRAVPVATVIEAVARLLGRPDLVRLGAQPRPLDDPPCIEADVRRLTMEFGFRPEFDLESGIADVVRQERRG
jgi:nucleoside-diphosphate-sugar epimerase